MMIRNFWLFVALMEVKQSQAKILLTVSFIQLALPIK